MLVESFCNLQILQVFMVCEDGKQMSYPLKPMKSLLQGQIHCQQLMIPDVKTPLSQCSLLKVECHLVEPGAFTKML